MVGLAVRKTPSRRTRYHAKRKVAKTTPVKKKAVAKKKVATKMAINNPILVARLKTMMDNMNTFIAKRKKQYGPNDPVAKRLLAIQKDIGKELRKANITNLSLARTLKKIPLAIRGVSGVPQPVRNASSLMKFIKSQVQTDAIKFINMIKTTISPMHTELKKLETQLNKYVKSASSRKLQLKVDPALKRRFNTLNNNITKFRTKWFKRLNGLKLHGMRNVETAVNQLKKQFDEIHKEVRKNLTIINRYSKALKPKKGFKVQQILTAGQVHSLETKFNRFNTELEKFRIHADHYLEQLKSAKLY